MLLYHIIQIITGVEGNIDYGSPRGTKYCPTRIAGQYICTNGSNIINVAPKTVNICVIIIMKYTNHIFPSQLNIEITNSILRTVPFLSILDLW